MLAAFGATSACRAAFDGSGGAVRLIKRATWEHSGVEMGRGAGRWDDESDDEGSLLESTLEAAPGSSLDINGAGASTGADKGVGGGAGASEGAGAGTVDKSRGPGRRTVVGAGGDRVIDMADAVVGEPVRSRHVDRHLDSLVGAELRPPSAPRPNGPGTAADAGVADLLGLGDGQ